jgi:hypothetical protein
MSLTARAPTPFTHDHPTAPLGAYGRSKLAGEAAVRAAAGNPPDPAHQLGRVGPWRELRENHAAAGCRTARPARGGRPDRRPHPRRRHRRRPAGLRPRHDHRHPRRHPPFQRRPRYQLGRFRPRHHGPREACPVPSRISPPRHTPPPRAARPTAGWIAPRCNRPSASPGPTGRRGWTTSCATWAACPDTARLPRRLGRTAHLALTLCQEIGHSMRPGGRWETGWSSPFQQRASGSGFSP